MKPDTLTLAELFDAYHEKKGKHLVGQWAKAAKTRRRLFLECWGAGTLVKSISQPSVDQFSRWRREAWLAKGKTEPLRDGALHADFRWLSSVFNWATCS